MANRIKGITIEIGGDTTKLDKSLESTNKQIKATQTNLRDVERLLKMDPGNAELLAQKQKLLGEAVDSTKNKLKTLQEAAKSADDALARGKAYESKYGPLKTEIDAVTQQLNDLIVKQLEMERDLSSGTISTQAYDDYSKDIDETRQRLNELRKAKADLDAEFQGSKLNQSQYDALQRELLESENATRDAERAFKSCSSGMDELGRKASEISDKAAAISSAFAPLSTGAAAIGAAILATVPATEELRSDLAALETNAIKAGVGVDSARNAFEALYLVSNETDSSIEAVSNLLQAGFTESNLQRAVEGLANAALAFPDTLKIESLADSLQETLATSSATGQFAELLERVGVNLDDFNEILSQTPNETDRLNLALSQLVDGPLAGYAQTWAQNNQTMLENKQSTLELQESIGRMAESITPLLTLVTDLATAFFDWFNGLDDKGKVAIGVILSLVAAISPVSGAISGVGNAIEGMSKIGALFSSTAGNSVWLTFAKWAAIITAVVVAVTLLIAGINVLMGKGEEMNSTLGSVGNITGDITGGISGRPARAASYSMRAVSAEDLPHLATGGVLTRPTVFMGGEYAGAGQDPEIVSPYSKMVQATEEALRNSGTGGRAERMVLEVRAADGFARYLSFNLAKESTRQGVDLVTT